MEEVKVAVCIYCNRPDLLNTYTPATLPHQWVCPSCETFSARGGSEIGRTYYEDEHEDEYDEEVLDPLYCCEEPNPIVEPQVDGTYYTTSNPPIAQVEGAEAFVERVALREYDAIVREAYPDANEFVWHAYNGMYEWSTVDDIPLTGVLAGYCTNCDSETCVEVTG